MYIEFSSELMKEGLNITATKKISCSSLAVEEMTDLLESVGLELGEPYDSHDQIIHVQDIFEVNPVKSVYYRVPFWRRPVLCQGKQVGHLLFHNCLDPDENNQELYKVFIGNNNLSDLNIFYIAKKLMKVINELEG